MIIEGKKLEEDAAAMRAAIALKNYCENQEDCSACIFGYRNSGCLCMVNDKIPRDYEPNENYLLSMGILDEGKDECKKEEPKADGGVDHPSHYQSKDRLECIEEMRIMFSDDAVKDFCRLNAYKYYYRAGNKAGESAEKDRKKAFWYMQYYVKIARGDKVDINKDQT